MYIIEIIVYTVFGNGEEQSWNKSKLIDEEISDQTLPLKEDFKKWMWLLKIYNLSFLIQFWLYVVQKIIINNSYKELI